ncbi:hypothetical protein H6P81_001345 [Aristolochia fimbriata]|uniref:Uncharacterized protein n=1 Tax=Aristolochia fimbriata TaxID=158543 RepID=A0AAV7F9W8_ARIFI|nr:hypothetical protein H6P81_001345 [Aristolochia fimbriata]
MVPAAPIAAMGNLWIKKSLQFFNGLVSLRLPPSLVEADSDRERPEKDHIGVWKRDLKGVVTSEGLGLLALHDSTSRKGTAI